MVKWCALVDQDVGAVADFAYGVISGRSFYNVFRGTPVGGQARRVLSLHGVTYGRRLARKALDRRRVRRTKRLNRVA